MAVTVLITRNVSNRIRGFLASSMLEIAPGVYVASRQSPAVRQRIWMILEEWFAAEKEASIVLVWQEADMPGGLAVKRLGLPPLNLVEIDGLLVTHRRSESDPSPPQEHITQHNRF